MNGSDKERKRRTIIKITEVNQEKEEQEENGKRKYEEYNVEDM